MGLVGPVLIKAVEAHSHAAVRSHAHADERMPNSPKGDAQGRSGARLPSVSKERAVVVLSASHSHLNFAPVEIANSQAPCAKTTATLPSPSRTWSEGPSVRKA